MRSDISTAPATAVPAPRPDQRSPAEEQVEERTLGFEGFAYHCRVVRQDRPLTDPLVLLGGSSQNRYAWLRHQKLLAASGTIITVDLPGYGSADSLPASYGLDFLSACVHHMMQELGVRQANIIGSCFGGAIALRYAQHYPDRVAKLGLVGMTLVIPDDYSAAVPRWELMLERGDRAQIATELVERFMSPPGTGLVHKHQAVSRLLYGQFMAQSDDDINKSVEHNARLMSHDWYRDAPVPAVPTLVCTGEFDTLCTPALGRKVAAALPTAAFTTIKHADHLAPVERIPEFCDLINRFCTEQQLSGLPYTNAVEWLGRSVRPGPGLPPEAAGGRSAG